MKLVTIGTSCITGVLWFTGLVLITLGSVASEPARQATKLEGNLLNRITAIGATREANQAGSIPGFGEDVIEIPEAWRPGDHYLDPFPEDAPIFKITADNLPNYQSQLAAGQRALLEQNEAYYLPVYQSRRTASYPDFILEGTRYNKANTRLVSDGNGIHNFKQGFPFPELSADSDTAALQALWNHMARFRGGHVERTVMQASVFEDGDFIPVKLYQRYSRAEQLEISAQLSTGPDNNVLFYYLDKIVSPARLAGTTLLVHETLDQSREQRRAWLYQQAQRRVRRAPGAVYDTPIPATYGLKTADSHDMFNGSPDKYSWRYIGKQALYIPYNAYRLASSRLRYQDILGKSRINPELLRWELHRVHKIEAVLNDGERHIYARRIFYLDEDSWTIVLAENYDHHDELWRISEGHLIHYYDQSLPFYAMEVTYDLLDKRYLVFGLSNEESRSYTFDKVFTRGDYHPSALRRGH